jgi:ABC-type Fe3+-hydroxamate transport system substrate-binding protein
MWRSLTDDLGRRIDLTAPPHRIVSLVPSLTELVCVLERGDRLVGVTEYCVEPPDVVARLPTVGGTKTPDLQRIIELRPELVLANAEENRREDFQSLIAAGVTVWVSFPCTLAAAKASVDGIGQVIDAGPLAVALVQAITAAERGTAGSMRVFCPIWRKPWMSFNRDTYADDLLRVAGGENVCAGQADRYPVVDLEAVRHADPQVILLPSEPYPFGERHLTHLAPLAETSAIRNRRVHLIDGKALFWYGPRTAPGLTLLRGLLAGT